MRYFIEISFNGKNYNGWQKQKNATSVQEILDRAMSILLHERIATTGCGRTDSGVHALQFFAHFDVAEKIKKPDELLYHLNAVLPKDIAAHRLIAVTKHANARHDAISRTYHYHIYFKKNPFLAERGYWLFNKPDFSKMNFACRVLKRYDDFSCFSKSRSDTRHNRCKIKHAEWKKKGEEWVFEITANRFLRGMVRAMVGTMLDMGSGKISGEDLEQILKSKSRARAGRSVPAQGLFLAEVKYDII
jgi:tRNA pseudouridine38-40 synthase